MNYYRNQIEKMAESTAIQDFVAGIDPTGVRTFRNSMDNTKNHGRHKFLGDAGGFVGGAVSGALLPAALTGAASVALKKKMPGLSGNLANMSKGSLDAFNPKKVGRYVKSLGKLSEFQGLGSKLMRQSNDLMTGVKKTQNLAKVISKGGKISPSKSYALRKNGYGNVLEQVKKGRNLQQLNGKIQDLNQDLSKNYYGGKGVAEGGERALTALTTIGTALGGGALNASSAHLQYNTGRSTKRMLDEQMANNKEAGYYNDGFMISKTAGTMSRIDAYKKLITGQALKDADRALSSGARKLSKAQKQLNNATKNYYSGKKFYGAAKENIPNIRFDPDFIKEDYSRMMDSARHANKINNAINSLTDLTNKVKYQTLGARVGTGAAVAGLGSFGYKTLNNRRQHNE